MVYIQQLFIVAVICGLVAAVGFALRKWLSSRQTGLIFEDDSGNQVSTYFSKNMNLDEREKRLRAALIELSHRKNHRI